MRESDEDIEGRSICVIVSQGEEGGNNIITIKGEVSRRQTI